MPHNSARVTEDSRIDFLGTLFDRLQEKNISYAIIHSGDNLQDALNSDIDIALDEHPESRVKAIIAEVCDTYDFRLVHRLHYEIPHGYYYIIASQDNPTAFLHIDCLYDPTGVNRYYLPTPFLIEDCTSPHGFPQVIPPKTALYLLLKRSFKPGLSEARYRELTRNLKQYESEVSHWVADFFGKKASAFIKQVANADSPESAQNFLEELAIEIHKSFICRHPLRATIRLFLDRKRKLNRLTSPSGFFLVLIGPDGCGKSTITNRLLDIMQRGYRQTWHFHWRPTLLPRLGGSRTSEQNREEASTPASVSKYRGPVSLFRFLYYSLDFIAGYWLRIYLKKAQTTFIIGERYFPDVIVHPARYGFSTPHWLMRFTGHLVPDPDLVVLLSNDPHEIYRRKAELHPDTIANQLAAYEVEIPHWGKSAVVDTNGSPDDIAGHIVQLIIEIQAKRLLPCHG